MFISIGKRGEHAALPVSMQAICRGRFNRPRKLNESGYVQEHRLCHFLKLALVGVELIPEVESRLMETRRLLC